MNIAFAGFRHSHIFSLYDKAMKYAHVSGCFEEDAKERKIVEESKKIKFNYSSYEEILCDKSVDAVAIGDYYGKRGKMVIDALKCGKHVICDKPICTALSELDEIERLVNKTGLKVSCMLDLRYMPQVQKAKEIIRSGALGKVHIVSFTGQHPLDYGKRPMWYFEEGKHGGTINDIAIHGIDLVRYITGENLSKVDFARCWNAFAKDEPHFKDCAQFNVRMGDMTVTGDVSYSAPSFAHPFYWNFCFWGEKGMVNFNRMDRNLYLYKADSKEIIECDDRETDYMRDFIYEVNGKETQMNTYDILMSQRQVLRIQKTADMLSME